LNAGTRETWHHRLRRADDLCTADAVSKPLVAFYSALLSAQTDLHVHLSTQPCGRPGGALDADLHLLHPHLPAFLNAVAAAGPEPLAIEARRLSGAGEPEIDEMLLHFWRAPSDRQFFAKAILQPYAHWLAEHGVAPIGRERSKADNRCPFCGGRPQLSVLRGAGDPALEGGARLLQCAMCLTMWPFRRALCPQCGEEDERQLGYFSTPVFDHLRLETCDGCRHYVKCVDLTRLGVAVPLVDEVASATLDAWATEHGYTKIELNLVGL
jgi:FdhE protein